MKNFTLFLICIIICLTGCGQSHTGDSSNMVNGRLTCLVLGYDSIIYYTGISMQMQDVHKGKITDSVFVSAMFKKIKSGGLSMVLKPGGGADMLSNFQEMIKLANNYEVHRPLVDSGDVNEDKAFSFVTPEMVKTAIRGEQQPPLKLNLPRDQPGNPNTLPGFPKSLQLVILLSESKEIYAYKGGDMRTGKKYTYPEITDLVKGRRSDKNFSVVIKAAKNTTYKNAVDLLDVMTTEQIQHYALIDITKEEEDYLHQIYP